MPIIFLYATEITEMFGTHCLFVLPNASLFFPSFLRQDCHQYTPALSSSRPYLPGTAGESYNFNVFTLALGIHITPAY